MRYVYESSYLLTGWFDSDLTLEGWFGEEFGPDLGPPPSSPIVESLKTIWTSATTAYSVDLPPTLTENDILWIQFQNADTVGSFTTVPSGYVEQVPVLHASGGNMITCYSHVVTAGEEASPPATADFVWANSLAGNALLTVIRGVDITAIVDVTYASVTNGTTAKTVPSVTTVTDDAIIIGGGQLQSASTHTINVPASGWTELLTSCGDGAGRGGVLGFKEVQATAGATGTAAFTQSSALQGYAYQVALRPAAVGLTQVSKDLQLIWNQNAVVADTLQLVWHDRAVIADTLQLIWNNRINVADNLQLVWNDYNLVADTLQLIWNDSAVVGDELILLWDTLGIVLTPVGKDLQLVWNVSATVADTLQLVWNDRAVIADVLQLLWNNRANVNDSLQMVWNDRALVPDSLQMIWNVNSPVAKALQLVWNDLNLAADNLQLVWNDRANVGDELTVLWNLLAGVSPVGKDLQLVWNVLASWIEDGLLSGSWTEESYGSASYIETSALTDGFTESPDATPSIWVEDTPLSGSWTE